MSPRKPRIVLTMGDPSGVGPELMLKVLSTPELWESPGTDDGGEITHGEIRQGAVPQGAVPQGAVPLVVGCKRTLNRCAERLSLPMPALVDVSSATSSGDLTTIASPGIVDIPVEGDFSIGEVQANCGRAAYEFVEKSIAMCLDKQVEGVVTGPINKAALHAAGLKFPGHTEIFAERTEAERWCMMQYSSVVTCTFVTVHCGYSEVPKLLTVQKVLDTIELTHHAMSRLLDRPPRILVCGLNPHAGEGGLFGHKEEETVIAPAIELARESGCKVQGPFPPDTVFVPARRAEMDAAVCMYHDQGHIPLKALAFDSAVNTTLGLPVIRTSVDHGTAFDIAWQGIADPGSFQSAIRLATRLAKIAS